jgi:murein DD-endopeptidase MepM/ murein hydrolase activator NlpD
MKCVSFAKSFPYITLRIFAIAFLLNPFVVSCSSFQGLGDLRTRGTYRPSGHTNAVPYGHTLGRSYSKNNAKDLLLEWPIDRAKLSQRYRPPRNPSHAGIDLAGRRGTPIYAAHEGFVVYAGRGYSGYGRVVLLEFNDEWATLYAHLDDFRVRTGDYVQLGEILGSMGDSGRATGVHLHFELIHNKLPVDPLYYLNGKN